MKKFLGFLAAFVLQALFCGPLALAYLPPKGVQFELVEFASEGKVVQGGYFSPDPMVFGKPATAVVVVHGVESYWYRGPSMFLGAYLAEQGYAVLGYNGAHSGESFRTSEFETAVKEVDAAIQFLKARGFRSIFLAGHSLGTPMVEYYQGDKPDPVVKAVGVYGPHINIPAITRDSLLGPELYAKFLADSRDLVAKGRGHEIKLLPYREDRVIITSAKSFVSYRDFDNSKAAVENMIRRIKVPLAIVYDRADNIQGKGGLTERETIAVQIRDTAVAAPRVDMLVIPSVAGNSPLQAHGFVKNEKIVTDRTVEWLKSVGLAPAPRLK